MKPPVFVPAGGSSGLMSTEILNSEIADFLRANAVSFEGSKWTGEAHAIVRVECRSSVTDRVGSDSKTYNVPA
jgi:hypothetical protein